MNAPLRRLSAALALLVGALMLSSTWVQAVKASDYANRPGNLRVVYREYSHQRGAITAGDTVVAESVRTRDRLTFLRRYPQGALYATATGFYSLVYGKTGIESAEDGLLSGDGAQLFVSRLSDYVTGRVPVGGRVQLTLDPAAQAAAAQALGNRRGAVVALDPRTGAVLALVTSPSYDPSVLTTHDPRGIQQSYDRLVHDQSAPLLDRALQQTYPPGSLFKVVTSAAALSTGRYQPSTQIPAPDRLTLPGVRDPLRNFGGERCSPTQKQSLLDALRISCNTAFAGLGLALGADRLREQAGKFGFGQDLRIPLGVARSVVPDDLDKPATAQSAIGQRDVRITPLQAAMLVSAVADHGRLMRPYLVARTTAPNLTELSRAEPESMGQAVSPGVADELAQMMRAVVDAGTGTAARIPGVAVAGKTGTAQHGPGAAPHAWFAGFAPADNPTVAVAVVVEDGGSAGSEATGGTVAAPVARAVLQAVLGEHR